MNWKEYFWSVVGNMWMWMWIFDCTEVSTPNPHIAQGSSVLTSLLNGIQGPWKVILCPLLSLDTLYKGNMARKNSKTSFVQGTKNMNIQKSCRWNTLLRMKRYKWQKQILGDKCINGWGAFMELNGGGACSFLSHIAQALVPFTGYRCVILSKWLILCAPVPPQQRRVKRVSSI